MAIIHIPYYISNKKSNLKEKEIFFDIKGFPPHNNGVFSIECYFGFDNKYRKMVLSLYYQEKPFEDSILEKYLNNPIIYDRISGKSIFWAREYELISQTPSYFYPNDYLFLFYRLCYETSLKEIIEEIFDYNKEDISNIIERFPSRYFPSFAPIRSMIWNNKLWNNNTTLEDFRHFYYIDYIKERSCKKIGDKSPYAHNSCSILPQG